MNIQERAAFIESALEIGLLLLYNVIVLLFIIYSFFLSVI